MRFNFDKREMIMKIVYFGPSLGGKTTTLRAIYSQLAPDVKGQFMSINTKDDRTLFFDFFDLATNTRVGGGTLKVRYELFTVPGQITYGETRRLVMKGADGVVFVADSQVSKMAENIESIADLHAILTFYNREPKVFPTVIQYNKRDLPDISSVEELRAKLNTFGSPEFSTVALTGKNVMAALDAISVECIKTTKQR
jgi:signal recognition particle receptor subunit beta